MRAKVMIKVEPNSISMHLDNDDEFYVEAVEIPDMDKYYVLRVGGASIYLESKQVELLARGMVADESS